MRLNKFIALSTDLSRRAADAAIEAGRVLVNGQPPQQGQDISAVDAVLLDGAPVTPVQGTTTIVFNKPRGYVVSRRGQGSRTIYELLPAEYQSLQAVGRLDKDSSGLLLLTNDGQLAQDLSHPSRKKIKIYDVVLNHALEPLHQQMISDHGIQLPDGLSRLQLERLNEAGLAWRITMHEGRNRQIRRTFSALGYTVRRLHRTQFGPYQLSGLQSGAIRPIDGK